MKTIGNIFPVPKCKKIKILQGHAPHGSYELLIRSFEITGEVYVSNYSLRQSTESNISFPNRQIETEKKSSKF